MSRARNREKNREEGRGQGRGRIEDPALRGKLQHWLEEHLQSEVQVAALHYLSGGACQENWSVDLVVAAGEHAGRHELVFRSDRGGSLLHSLSRSAEYEVASAAYRQGVKTPLPIWVERNSSYIGRPFYFMERLKGGASGRYLIKDASLKDTRGRLPQLLARNLALIHSITPQNASPELKEALAPAPIDAGKADSQSADSRKVDSQSADGRGVALETLRAAREELAQFPEAHPAIELGLNWLEANAPVCDQIVLCHGDYRTGNFMVSPQGLEGILDWEFAHWGDRHEDISYLCLREWRFGRIGKQLGGFGDRAPFYKSYEACSGAAIDEERCRYWEIANNLRWAVGCLQQGERHLNSIDRGIEIGAIGRRAAEMEYEMMRLIEAAAC